MKPEFPITAEAFIAHQEELASRELTEIERATARVWSLNFNAYYEDGLRGDEDALHRALGAIDEGIAKYPDPVHLLSAIRRWALFAWGCGRYKDSTRSAEGGETVW